MPFGNRRRVDEKMIEVNFSNSPSKYRISKPSEILAELDLNIGAISDSLDEAEDLDDVVEKRRTSHEIEAA